ncbi:MAG: hypothetical protein U1C12_01855, partial [Patescibacteria group bacterium]|nr:hypothetical protein [Patescibacteria group bacterium]
PDKESRGRGKDDDTPEKNTKAKGKEKARTEKKGSGEDEQRRRLEDLQREAEEARESSERTLREATSSVDPDQVEQVLKKLRESGQLRDIPIDKAAADAQLGVARGAYEGKGENADVVLETEVGSNQVGIYRDRGKMVLTGLPDTKYKSEVLAKLFKEAGIAKKIEFPKGFNEWTVEKRQEYVAENFGVKTIDNELLGYAPTPDPITPLPSMTGDLGIFERDMKKAIIIGELPNSLERLRRIEQDLDKAVREASLKDADRDVMINPDTDEDVILVRDALRQSIEVLEEELNTKTDEDRKSREEEILRDRGEINFDEHFGNHYKNTREAVLRRDRATLRDIMVDAKKEVEKLNNLPTSGPNKFDIDKEETWPEDIDVRKVFEVTRALKQQAAGLRRITLEQIMGGDGPDFDLLREFITENREVNLLEQVNKFYRNIYANLTPARRRALVGRIDDNAATATSSISGGWSEFNHRMKQLFDVVEGSRQMELVDDELRLTRAGRFQEWRGLTQIAGVEQAVEFAQLMQPPPDWEDTPVAVNKLIAAYESSGLTAQDLQPVISAGFGMLARINQNTEHGRGMYAELKEQLEAFKFKQAEIITAHVKSMDPEALGHVYESEMEGTLEVTQVAMISRFERDANGRRLYTKERDVSKEVNLFDTAKKIYSERLRDERIRMNMVEELTKYSISSLSESDKDEMRESVGYKYLSAEWQARWDSELASIRDWLEQRMNRLVNPIDSATGLVDFAKRKVNKDWFDTSDDPNADNATLSNPALWKSVRWAKGKMRGSLTKRTIQDWYERKTLHGAFGEVKEDGLDELFGTFEKDGSYKKGELTDLFRDLGDTDDKKLIERLREQFGNGQSWLQVRRAEMRRRIFKELKNMNLQYDANVHYGKHGVRGGDLKKMTDEDFEYLMDTGYMSSLETNAFDRSWLLEWSTYSFIHIYGENNKRSDNYQALVYNKSSDLYNAWIVDHNWEYLHPDFEDRG